MADKQEWRSRSLCKNLNEEQVDEVFFPGPGKRATTAREFCGHCPVRRECLNFAIAYDERGMWAGTSYEERREMAGLVRSSIIAHYVATNTLESRNPEDWGLIDYSRKSVVTTTPLEEQEVVDLLEPPSALEVLMQAGAQQEVLSYPIAHAVA